MAYIIGYGCHSSAGTGVKQYWEGLLQGIDHSQIIDPEGWPVKPKPIPFTCLIQERPKDLSIQTHLTRQLLFAWEEVQDTLSQAFNNEILQNLGVIFSSTKGCIEDFIWAPKPNDMGLDPLTPILNEFISTAKIKPKRFLSMTNACASSHSAMFLANQWLKKNLVQYVLVLAADFLGPFIVNGFQSLQALSQTKNKPFSKDRDGLQLGEAAVALLLGSNPVGPYSLKNVQLYNEDHAITRPKPDGEGLKRIYQSFGPHDLCPDLVIAHGTGTIHNDLAEDQAITNSFRGKGDGPPITNTKWSIGHTLGASGAMDVIAACESLRSQKCFAIANTVEIDPEFKGKYLSKKSEHHFPKNIKSIIVNSLGFGGITGALEIRAAT